MEDITNRGSRNLKIKFSNGQLNCRVLGRGIKNIICFYGFGQSANHLRSLSNALNQYTCYVLDLPFHGESEIYNPEKPMDEFQLIEIIQNLKSSFRIKKFSLMGISIGANLVFQIIFNFAADIESIFLIAPDGIRRNIWYTTATANKCLRFFSRRIILSDKLPNLITLGRSLMVIDPKTAAFVANSIEGKKARQRVYDTWCYLRKLKLNSKLIADIINNHSIEVIFVIGANDRIISKKTISKLSSRIIRKEIIELNAGHHNVVDHYSKILRQ